MGHSDPRETIPTASVNWVAAILQGGGMERGEDYA